MRHSLVEFGRRHYTLATVVAFLILVIICLLNNWLFSRLFQASYFAWYLKTGPVIGLATTIAAVVWSGFDRQPGFISRNPLAYAGSYLQLAGLTISALATILNSKNQGGRPALLDLLLSIIFIFILFLAILVWLFVVVPFQYFVFLICGAVPRLATHSSVHLIASMSGNQLVLEEKGADEKLEAGSWDATLADRPFKLASSFSIAFFFLIGQIGPYLGLTL